MSLHKTWNLYALCCDAGVTYRMYFPSLFAALFLGCGCYAVVAAWYDTNHKKIESAISNRDTSVRP